MLDGRRADFVGEIGETEGLEGVPEKRVYSCRWIKWLHPVQWRGIAKDVSGNEDLFGSVFNGVREVWGASKVKCFPDDLRGLVSKGNILRVMVSWAREASSDALPTGVLLLIALDELINMAA